MTDKQFQRAIDSTILKMKAYKKCLEVAEEEYKIRYGHYPSDLNNDKWIDSLHIEASPLTVSEVEETAILCNEINK